jgi:protein-tyrosine-phosphatase
MAHAIAVSEVAERNLNIRILSAGVIDFSGTPTAIQTWVTCCQNGTPPQTDHSTFIKDLPLRSISKFMVMEKGHASALTSEYDIDSSRITLLGSLDPISKSLEIDDPIGQGSVEFDRCYSRLKRCIVSYLDTSNDINSAEIGRTYTNLDDVNDS